MITASVTDLLALRYCAGWRFDIVREFSAIAISGTFRRPADFIHKRRAFDTLPHSEVVYVGCKMPAN